MSSGNTNFHQVVKHCGTRVRAHSPDRQTTAQGSSDRGDDLKGQQRSFSCPNLALSRGRLQRQHPHAQDTYKSGAPTLYTILAPP